MDTKIFALQQVGVSAIEKAKKLLPKDVDVPPQALRCEYPLHVYVVPLQIVRIIHKFVFCMLWFVSAQVLGRPPQRRSRSGYPHRSQEYKNSCIPMDVLRRRRCGREASLSEVQQC